MSLFMRKFAEDIADDILNHPEKWTFGEYHCDRTDGTCSLWYGVDAGYFRFNDDPTFDKSSFNFFEKRILRKIVMCAKKDRKKEQYTVHAPEERREQEMIIAKNLAGIKADKPWSFRDAIEKKLHEKETEQCSETDNQK